MAPFKLHFSKLSKSRSDSSQGSSRNNSVESEQDCHNNHYYSGQHRQLSTESAGSNTSVPMIGDGGASFVSGHPDPGMPASSPPPSYERVLEETRLKRSLVEDEEEIEENNLDESEVVNTVSSLRSSGERIVVKGPEILHKSSKDFYRAMAKQWGITCKMSDNCRCLDCQSRYFDCDYEKYEQEQTDGGLGAGAPLYVSEVIHGTACALL